MAKILLDYVFPISVVPTVPAASTAFLKQVIVVATPKSGQEGNVGELYECTSMTAVAARTDNTNAQQLFDAGMAKVYVLLSTTLDIADYMEEHNGSAFTVLISDDFDDEDVEATLATGTVTISSYANLIDAGFDTVTVGATVFTAQAGAATLGTATFRAETSNDATATSLAAQINGHAVASTKVVATVDGAVVTLTAKASGKAGNLVALSYADNGTATIGASVSGSGFLSGGDGLSVGAFDGVVGYSSSDEGTCADFASAENRCGFYGSDANGAKSMFYAFGKLLSNLLNWANQQYVTMPVDDGVDTLGGAESLYDDKVSFTIHDSEFGNRLALFCAGGKAIVAPYIGKNLQVDLQSRTLSWIAANQPAYTMTNAALLQQRLQEDVINVYVNEPRKWIEAGVISVDLLEDNFVASGSINIAEPKALWRVVGEMRSTL
jgi:hypothetical protein